MQTCSATVTTGRMRRPVARIADAALDGAGVVLLAAEVLVLFTGIIARTVFIHPLIWSTEFARLPKTRQDIVTEEFGKAGHGERQDIADLGNSLKSKLAAKGMTVLDVDKAAFRSVLGKTKYYPHWKQKFGAEAWGLLEKTAGPLE